MNNIRIIIPTQEIDCMIEQDRGLTARLLDYLYKLLYTDISGIIAARFIINGLLKVLTDVVPGQGDHPAVF